MTVTTLILKTVTKYLIILITLSFSQSYFKDWIHLDIQEPINDTSFIKLYNQNDILFIDLDNENKIIKNLTGIELNPKKYFKKIYIKSFKNKINQISDGFLNVKYDINYNEIGTNIEYRYTPKIQFNYNTSLNNINKKINHLFMIGITSLDKMNVKLLYSRHNYPYQLNLMYDEFNFQNHSSINEDLFSVDINYYLPSYSLSFRINDYNVFTTNSKQSDFLYINTIENKEFITNFLYTFNNNELKINASINNIQLDGHLGAFEQNIYTINKYKSYHNKINIAYTYNKHSIFGLNYKSLLFDVIGTLRASAVSDELLIQFGAPIINNINKFKINQFFIFYNKHYKDYFLDIQIVNEYYDIYYQTMTPPFNPLIPIINFERMNIKNRIAINLGISKTYHFNNSLVKVFFKQHIPIKNYYYDNNNVDEIENKSYNQYGGGLLGLNIYFN